MGGVVFLLLVLLEAMTSACASQAYEIIDTGILGRRAVFWIDNQRVLFAGYDPTRVKVSELGNVLQSVLYTWDLKTRQATIHADIPETDYVCYRDGFVSYAVSKDGERYIREGKLGAEKERKWTPPAPGKKIQFDFNELSCKDMDLLAAEKVYPGYWFIPLREGHGYRGAQKREPGKKAPETPWFYLPAAKGKTPIPLPVRSIDRISYSEYMGSYVIEDTPSQRREDTSGKLWLLYLDGRVIESTIPAGPWMRGSVGYAPAKAGIIMWSHAVRAGAAGIHLVSGGKVERLIAGSPGDPIAVSPDGCKFAGDLGSRLGVRSFIITSK